MKIKNKIIFSIWATCLIAIIIVTTATFALYFDQKIASNEITMGKVELTAGDLPVVASIPSVCLPGQQITTGPITCSASATSGNMFIRAGIMVTPDVSASVEVQNYINGLFDGLSAYADGVGYTWTLYTDGWYYLCSSGTVALEVADTTSYTFINNSIAIPLDIAEMEDNAQYGVEFDLTISVQAIQSATIVDTSLSNLSTQFATI